MTCDVCRKNGRVFVHASTLGPMSFASCAECLSQGAEPELTFHYLYDFVSTDGEGLDPAISEIKTFKDDAYMTWTEWVSWRQHPDRKAELDAKRDADFAAMNERDES